MTQKFFKNSFPLSLVAFVAIVYFMGVGCKKESLLQSGGKVDFSTDTLTFDTVFTAAGSFTCSLKIYNPQDQRVVLSSVRLEKGNASFFRLNVDGQAGNDIKDVEIAAKDSAFVFATVNIDPNDEDNPFFIEDKLIASLNGNDYSIPVLAYGQNAHYVIDSQLAGNQTWLTDRPYVIVHSAQVLEGNTLTIPAGCRVYMHQDSRLIVDGTLKVNGTLRDSVVFQGDRLDRAYFGYEGYPGEWGGIYFSSKSKSNVMTYAILKNGGNTALGALPALIQVNPDSVADTDPQLLLDRVILQNSIGYGIVAFSADVKIQNCLMHTCGAQVMALVRGGKYVVENSTIVNYGSDKVSHVDNSAGILLNYFKNGNVLEAYPLDATLTNCIFYGSLQNELVADSIDAANCVIRLNNCAVKGGRSNFRPWVQMNAGMQFDQDPQFVKTETEKWDFKLKTGSPLIDKGLSIPSLTTDLAGNARPINVIDIGAYEQ